MLEFSSDFRFLSLCRYFMAQPTTLLGITTDRMDLLIMLGRIGGTDTGHVAAGGIIEIRITFAGQNFIAGVLSRGIGAGIGVCPSVETCAIV
jgi:hypothetical protein